MTINDIKKYVVIVNGGSGCIFQPQTDEYTYVLTAKHIFDDIDAAPYDGKITIIRFQFENREWKEMPIYIHPLTEGSNYFPHPKKDIAILKIGKIYELDNLVRIDDLEQDRKEFTLAGYPKIRREDIQSKWFRLDEHTEITIKKDNGLREGKIVGNPDINDIKGQSGGGILKIYDGFILLAGIQNKMVDGSEQLGCIEFSPIVNFDEIVEIYKDNLLPVSPIYSKEKIWLEKYAKKRQSQFSSPDLEKNYIELLMKEKVAIKEPGENVNSANEKTEYVKGRLSDFVFNKQKDKNNGLGENGQSKLLLLGEGGSGKSTSLLKLASEALSIALKDENAPIPIYVKLNSFNPGVGEIDGLFSYISNEIEEPDILKFKKWYYESDRSFLFLFDGFNEAENQKILKKILENFLEKKSHYYVISSRPGEGSKYVNQISGLRKIEVEPLDNIKIKQYLVNHGAIELYKQLDEDLKKLVSNPFMLWALFESCRNSTNYELPHNIGQLYKNFIENKIIETRESKLELPYDKVLKEILGNLGYIMTCKNVTQVKLNDVGAELNSWLIMERDKEENQWLGEIMPDKPAAIGFLNDAIQHGIIRSIGNTYEFMHQTVQEYYTAVHMSSLPMDEDELLNKIPKRRSRQINIDTKNIYLDSKDMDKELEGPDAGWFRVPFLMLSGILEQPEIDDFLKKVRSRNILMAAKCLSASTNASDNIKEEFIDSWKKLLDKQSPILKCLGCLCFGYSKMDNNDLSKILIDLIKDEKTYDLVRRTAAKALGYSGKDNNVHKIISLAISDNESYSEYTWGKILNSINSIIVVHQLFDYFRDKQNPIYSERAKELLEELDTNKIANAFLDISDEEISKTVEEGVRVKFKYEHKNYYDSIFKILNAEKVIGKLVNLYIVPEQEEWYYERIKKYIYSFEEKTLRNELEKLIVTSDEKSDKKVTTVRKLLSGYSSPTNWGILKMVAIALEFRQKNKEQQEVFYERLKNSDLNTLVQKLKSNKGNERIAAIKLLGANKNRDTLEILLNRFQNEEYQDEIYKALMSELCNIEDKEYIMSFFKKNVSNPHFYKITDLKDSVIKELDLFEVKEFNVFKSNNSTSIATDSHYQIFEILQNNNINIRSIDDFNIRQKSINYWYIEIFNEGKFYYEIKKTDNSIFALFDLTLKLKLIDLVQYLDDRVISDLMKFITPNEPSIIRKAALNSLAKFKNFDLFSCIEGLLDFETNIDIIGDCIQLLADSKSQLAIPPLLRILNKIEFSENSFNLFHKFSLNSTL